MRSARLALVVPLVLAACAGSREAAPVPEMRITDPGQIYSTYDLRNDTQAHDEVRAQGVSEAGWQEIVRLANESQWPPAIQDLTGRSTHRDAIRRYRTFRVAAFADKVILLVPADQGNAVPPEMQGRKFYIVIGQGAVN